MAVHSPPVLCKSVPTSITINRAPVLTLWAAVVAQVKGAQVIGHGD
jgi:hypothetical protein